MIWKSIPEEEPLIGQVVWLWDGEDLWIGGKAYSGIEDEWLWGNADYHIWHNGVKWDGDFEIDHDYRPTHWASFDPPPPAIL